VVPLKILGKIINMCLISLVSVHMRSFSTAAITMKSGDATSEALNLGIKTEDGIIAVITCRKFKIPALYFINQNKILHA